VDEIICLGDAVGYGPNPAEVFEACYGSVHHMVMGNHDAAVCGKMHLDRFNNESRRTIEWTQSQLDPSAKEFLAQLPLIVGGDNAIFTHGSVDQPSNFDYVYDAQECVPSWDSCSEQLIFAGHTHLPEIHMIGEMGVPQSVPPRDIRLSDNIRYFVNVGSVGQPRDGDVRSCYVIYDSDQKFLSFRRVQFNIDGYFAGLKANGLAVHPAMVGEEAARVNDFNPLSMPMVMGQESNIQTVEDAQELNQRFETLSDRRADETREQRPSKPVRGKKLKSTYAKSRSGAKTTAMKPSGASTRIDATKRMRPHEPKNTYSRAQQPVKKKSPVVGLLLVLGTIILIGVIVGIIMVLSSK
jgi:predicted phosphodiesterase